METFQTIWINFNSLMRL